MKALKKILFACLIFIYSMQGMAQQEVLYTQYYFSQLAINPAYAGHSDGLSLTAMGKKQWVGIEGAPTTYLFIAHTPVIDNYKYCSNTSTYNKKNYRKRCRGFGKKDKQLGVGLIIFNDHIGVTNTLISSFSCSSKIKINHWSHLSLGIQASMLHFGQSLNQLENPDDRDPNFQNDIEVMRFNMGAGIFFETERFYFGASIPEANENSLSRVDGSKEKQLRQYFFTGGYVFNLNRVYKFKPTFLIRQTEGVPLQFDINANLLYYDKIGAGLAYRYDNSINFNIQTLFSDNLRLGIAYDYALGKINNVTNGSAELMVNYIFSKKKKRITRSRYF